MRTLHDIRDEVARPFREAASQCALRLESLATESTEAQKHKDALRQAVEELSARKTALGSPATGLREELQALERQVATLQRDIETRQGMLRQLDEQSGAFDERLRKERSAAAEVERQVKRLAEEAEVLRNQIRKAEAEIRDAHVRCLQMYVDEAFAFLQRYGQESTPRERYERLRAAFDEALGSDQGLRTVFAERNELVALLKTAQVPSIRDGLTQSLRHAEALIEQGFPGVLNEPPPAELGEVAETYFWYEPNDDLTFLLLPIPLSCWRSPPTNDKDPRGPLMCRLLWSFVEAAGDPVPSIDSVGDLVVLEFLGDQTDRLAERMVEAPIAAGRIVTFLQTNMPSHVAEALR